MAGTGIMEYDRAHKTEVYVSEIGYRQQIRKSALKLIWVVLAALILTACAPQGRYRCA